MYSDNNETFVASGDQNVAGSATALAAAAATTDALHKVTAEEATPAVDAKPKAAKSMMKTCSKFSVFVTLVEALIT